MSLKSKLKIEYYGIFAAIIFYAVSGIASLAVLPMTNFATHLGIVGIISLITAYGLFKKRNWATWPIVILFFVNTAISASMLYFAWEDLFLDIIMIVYFVLTWVFTAYAFSKRKLLES